MEISSYHKLAWVVAAATMCLITTVRGACRDGTPSFPIPAWEGDSWSLAGVFSDLSRRLDQSNANDTYANLSYAIEITSGTKTLWTYYHTADKVNKTGVEQVDGQSVFRIASISKVFTTLGILYQESAGNLSLQAPVSKYIQELAQSGSIIDWNHISIRSLASQISGIRRESGDGDLLAGDSDGDSDPSDFGLPSSTKTSSIPGCRPFTVYDPDQSIEDFICRLRTEEPLFMPDHLSSYSNTNFDILGLVLERITGKPYDQYMSDAIFNPLEMNMSTASQPTQNKIGIIPDEPNDWDTPFKYEAPSGSLFVSTSDMSKFLRYTMNNYHDIATGINWLLPQSWSGSSQSFYGMPWEIFSTDRLLDRQRPVHIVSKQGDLTAYDTYIAIIPEYGLGISIFNAGSPYSLDDFKESLIVPLIRGADKVVWANYQRDMVGNYTISSDGSNSSASIVIDSNTGIQLASFTANDLPIISPDPTHSPIGGVPGSFFKLLPTGITRTNGTQIGDVYHFWNVPPWNSDPSTQKVFDDDCDTDVDGDSYAGAPVEQAIFWRETKALEFPRWNLTLTRG